MLLQRVTTLTSEAIDNFRNSLLDRGKSEKTAKAYSTDLKILLQETHLQAIPMEDFEDIGMNWLTANRNALSAKTTGRRLTSLKQFARWARWPATFEEYNPPVPLKGQPHPLPEGIEGVERMIAVANSERHAALIALCGLQGLRISEALNTRPGNFDTHEMTLHVYGKGAKERKVPVSEKAWNVLQTPVARAYCEGSPTVVGLKDRFARALVTQLGRRAKLKRHVASHDLRATFATAVYDATLDKRLVQILLGHASGETTEVYIGRTENQLRAGVEKL